MSLLRPSFEILVFCLLMVLSLEGVSQYRVRPFDVSKKITALQLAKDGSLIYGTETGEFGEYDGIIFRKRADLRCRIHRLEITENDFYILTSKGLFRVEEKQHSMINGNSLNVLAKSEDGSFLVTANGVYNRLNSDYLPNKEDFFNINEISKGEYFEIGDADVFRADNKIYLKKKKRWKELASHGDEGFSVIPWNSKQMMIFDQKGLITFDTEGYLDTLLHKQHETESKLFRISTSEVLLCANDSIGIYNVRKKELNTIYKLRTNLITSVVVDEWENIWIAAGSYLYQIVDTSNEKRNQTPKIFIESIRVNGKQQALKSSFKLDNDNNEVEIDYNGVHLTYPQQLEFQTLLSVKYHSLDYNSSDEGKWTKASKAKNVEYRNLKPGKYTFQLRGSVDGQYFMYTKPITFTVESDLFQSVWLIVLLGAVSVLILALFFNSRYNSLKEKSKQDRDKLIRENKMLTLQQKALQLQMNPHFVFNALNSIQGLIALNDNQKARKYLQEFSTMMRSVLNQSRIETILIGEEVDYLKSYLSLEQMANNDKFDWEVNVDPNLEDDVRIPTMIIQPFVENAIVHGIKTLKGRRGEVLISLEGHENKVLCTVKDNGIGRKAAQQIKSSTHKSIALEVVRERLRSKLSASRDNPIRYEDVLDANGNQIGTQVEVEIPIMN